jgi:hypothetical protein
MKLIFDFDDVLFNAAVLKKNIFSVLEKYGITNGKESYDRARLSGEPFSLKRFFISSTRI